MLHRFRLFLSLAICALALAATPARPQTADGPAGLKGVWEPVNYPADLSLNDVFFVTPEIGYVSGAAGTILKTTNAGNTWTAQLGGDPASEQRPIERLVFVSPTVGWSTQTAPSNRRHLYRTTDGENWETVGSIEEHYEDMAFASENIGVYIDDTQIWRTADGGRTWNEVYRCSASAQVGGLTRQIECNLWNVHFATPTVAYAVGAAKAGVAAAVVVKSSDSGASWSVASLLENQDGVESGLYFVDENTGYLAMRDAKAAFRTTDGGQTWTGIPATAIHRRLAFADPEVGWAMRYNQLSYTTDGGRRWSTQTIRFPATENAFSLPRRDVGYAVGDHGMIYRYRMVPEATSVAANAVAGVAMPPLANSVIKELSELETRLDGVGAAVAAGGEAPGTDAQSGSLAVGEDRGWVEANYAEFGKFETTLDGVATGLPELGRRHRNLNLMGEGLRLLGELTTEGGALQAAFASLRQGKDPGAIAPALVELQAQIDAAKSSVMAFQSWSAPEP